MKENAIYFGKKEYYELIKKVGGTWNDAKERINKYLGLPEDNIASCYYHVGRTTTKSIFFISDVVPITDKYIEREYLGRDSKGYVIKNPNLLAELQRKVRRIIYYEDKNPNLFRQHITDVKHFLIDKIEKENSENEN